MNGLRAARVLVIEDSDKDARGLMKALAKNGIATIWLDESPDGIPDVPIGGVRLVAADLHLTGTDSIDATIAVMGAAIAEENGPYLAIAWTAYPQDTEKFIEMCSRIPCPPTSVIAIGKSDCKVDGNFDIDLIDQKLQSAIASQPNLEVLNLWEQAVFDSTSDIAGLAAGCGGSWGDEFGEVLSALLRESTHDLDDPKVNASALINALAPLQADAVETRAADSLHRSATAMAGLTELAQTGRVRDEMKPIINRRLLTAKGPTQAMPGTIYKQASLKEKDVIGGDKLTVLGLADPLSTCFPRNFDPEATAPVIPIVVEVTPSCDFQNGKVENARFLEGVLLGASALSSTKQEKLKPHGSAWTTRRIQMPFDESGPEYILAVSARLLFTVPREDLAGTESLFRLRRELFLDLQAWLAYQSGRPGHLAVT